MKPMRSMTPTTPRSLDLLVIVGLIGSALLLASSVEVTPIMIPVVLAFSMSGLFPITSASDRVYDLFYLVAATVPFLFSSAAPATVVLLTGVAILRIARVLQLVPSQALSVDLRKLVGSGIYTALVLGADAPSMIGDSGTSAILIVGAAFLLWFAYEILVRSASEVRSTGVGLAYLISTIVRDAPLFAALVGAGAIFGVVWQNSVWWVALVVALVPFGMTVTSFRRHGSVRGTYAQTILALARIPEVAGLALEGHAERTAELAVAVAKDMGLAPHRVQLVQYAALMHDIGKITLTEPSIVERGYTDADLDRWSAEIIGEAEYLRPAANVVSVHNQPFRRPGEEADPDLPIEAKIIRASSHFDRYVFGEGMRPLEALEKLHQGAAYDFDPRVVKSVRLVLDRMGVTTV